MTPNIAENVMTIREFTRNIYTYMKPGEYVVTINGVETFKVVVTSLTEKDLVSADNTPNPVYIDRYKELIMKYGCGCKKTEELLCPKHGRV